MVGVAKEVCDELGGGDTARHETQITEIVHAHLPHAFGNRHRCIFQLARTLKGLPQYADSPAEDLREIVRAWHAKAVENLGTKDFDSSWWDFIESWDQVLYPIGDGTVDRAIKQAAAEPVPAVADRYESEAVRRLVAVCRQLQIMAGDKPFFLSSRSVAKLCKSTAPTAALRLRGLCRDKVLKLVEQGKLEGRKASEYRYLPPLDK